MFEFDGDGDCVFGYSFVRLFVDLFNVNKANA